MIGKKLSDDTAVNDFGVQEANSEVPGLADRLRTAVSDAGKQADIATAAGISLGTLKNYLRGSEPKLGTLLTLAKVTKVRLEWLATGEGPMHQGDPVAPPASPHEGEVKMFQSLNMDTLADAFETARQGLLQRGLINPNPRRIMQITSILYDEMRAGRTHDVSPKPPQPIEE
ncbi:helix-turn-helix domain-containing protein [Humitalea sp. 24SJ18S-53]|uniref:helix-turn-helix domain-containing protein n=1 Tax=Humitalea sp. 24SJ18S-53 TaxID=3422307 RepID=UPI003D66B6A2